MRASRNGPFWLVMPMVVAFLILFTIDLWATPSQEIYGEPFTMGEVPTVVTLAQTYEERWVVANVTKQDVERLWEAPAMVVFIFDDTATTKGGYSELDQFQPDWEGLVSEFLANSDQDQQIVLVAFVDSNGAERYTSYGIDDFLLDDLSSDKGVARTEVMVADLLPD